MRREVVVRGKGLAGTSDLTLLAPIRTGFVPALDAVTYKSRAKRILDVLHAGRASAHEYAYIRPLSDAIERIGRIHSVRVMVTDADQILLAATFDGSWESYFRVLWQKTGRLLDAIYCNTVGYVTAWDHTYEEWRAWAKSVQVETNFFYGIPSMTVDDQRYLRNLEQHARRSSGIVTAPGGTLFAQADLDGLRYGMQTAEATADRIFAEGIEFPDSQGLPPFGPNRELIKQSLQSLAGIYALTDLYPPTTPDGSYLKRAAVEFLSEFVTRKAQFDSDLQKPDVQRRFSRQLGWLERALAEPVPATRTHQPLPTSAQPFDRCDVQGGIVESYGPRVSHGCALLLSFESAAGAGAFLGSLLGAKPVRLTTAETKTPLADEVVSNIAFTFEGLRQLGLDEHQLALFPDDFRQGMATRAGHLGDLRSNHPRRWARPYRYGGRRHHRDDRVDMSAVHAVLQLRIEATAKGASDACELADAGHPLRVHVDALEKLAIQCGVQLLAVEALKRNFDADKEPREHFGFVDGQSDPTIDPTAADGRINLVRLGELICGYDNEGGRAPSVEFDAQRTAWIKNGSFLVVRKLRQHVDRLHDAVAEACAAAPDLEPEVVLGKLMGRRRTGESIIFEPPGSSPVRRNDFTYLSDPEGRGCPFHAHIRRANPRVRPSSDSLPGARTPHIARRGMSYGRPYRNEESAHSQNNASERGLLFMAYNASLGEQYEVVQQWLAGGNSSGALSGPSDPILGVPENGRQRWFRFEHNGRPVRMRLDGSDALLDDPKPFVRLEWGAYFFAPSISALKRLQERATTAANAAPVWNLADGERIVQRLLAIADPDQALLEWKRALEDVESVRTFVAASVWSAIRANHGGVLRTAYGVLVADKRLVQDVLTDKARISVKGYRRRMRLSIGEDFLGLDDTGPGCPYQVESNEIIDAIQALDEEDAFHLSRQAARAKFEDLKKAAQTISDDFDDPRYEVILDPREIIDAVLAGLCEAWFGIDDSPLFKNSGMQWDWKKGDPVPYPGHFGASSRYIFQPHPGEEAERFGQAFGEAVRQSMKGFVSAYTSSGASRKGAPAPLLSAAIGRARGPESDPDLVARKLSGAIMGFVPTLDGALRRVLSEWTGDGTFWRLRAQHQGTSFRGVAEARASLLGPMQAALQLRPTPEMIWRTATTPFTLYGTDGSPVPIADDDILVLSLVSSLQQSLLEGSDDLHAMFGGDRESPNAPTHACPGFKAAMGAMLGTLAAFLERRESMRPGPIAPGLMIEGNTQ